MFSPAQLRLAARLTTHIPFSGAAFRAVAASRRATLQSHTNQARALVTTSRLAFPAKGTTQSDSPKKPRAAPKTKDAPKKKPAPKPKVEKIRLTSEVLPPRRPITAFIAFFRQYMQGQPKSDTVAATQNQARDAGLAWRALSDGEKEVYLTQARTEFIAYKEKYAEWMGNVDYKVLKAINERKARLGKPRVVRRKGSPDSRAPPNAYMRFCKHIWDNDRGAGLSSIDIVRRAGELWRNMPEEEKEVYKAPAAAERAVWHAAKNEAQAQS